MRGGPGGRGRCLGAGTGLAGGLGAVALRGWSWQSGGSRGSRRCGRLCTPARSRAVAAREVWKPPVPGAPKEEGRRGTACSLPPSGLLGQFARATLGNLLTGKLGRETNANVLEELRVTSLGAEALFSFPAPCPTSARLGQRRMCHQFGALGGIPGPAGSGST